MPPEETGFFVHVTQKEIPKTQCPSVPGPHSVSLYEQIYVVFHVRKNFIWGWNNMRVSK